MIALDCETNGLDFYHGAKPYLVTTCTDEGEIRFWEWNVDPFTREPEIPPHHLEEIRTLLEVRGGWGIGFDEEIRERHTVITQNGKYDAQALERIGVCNFPWHQNRDTLIAGHVLFSNRPKDLIALAMTYLDYDLKPVEDAMEEAVKQCRRWCRGKDWIATHGKWRIADDKDESMPSVKGKAWKQDAWLPRACMKVMWETSEAGKEWAKREPSFHSKPNNIFRLALNRDAAVEDCTKLDGWEWRPPGLFRKEDVEDPGHPYWTVTSTYANADSSATVLVWMEQKKELHRRKLWKIFMEQMKLPPIIAGMERRGVTESEERLVELKEEYKSEAEENKQICEGIAETYGYNLEMPKGPVNKSLTEFCFNVLNLKPIYNKKAKSSNPCLDSKNAIPYYLDTLTPRSKPLLFIQSLSKKRKYDTKVAYLEGYERFWLPVHGNDGKELPGWKRLHGTLNQTGTDTLRFSMQNPNTANISKAEDEDGRSLRFAFGPLPDREWWSLDAKNIELRIPFYTCGEQELIDLFEKENEPPFYGSVHLLNFSIVYPEIWADAVKKVGLDKAGPWCKKTYKSTYYQWVKNGDFAVQYGAMDREDGTGTADLAFHRPGAHAILKQRFSKLENLNQQKIREANQKGYVETLPDKSVDPERGYPLMCARTDYGQVLPTVPLNYFSSGTAMQWTRKAMVRCEEELSEWRTKKFDAFMTLQVHDELVFDLPKRDSPVTNPRTSNLGRVRKLAQLMAKGGDDIGIPVPVGIGWNEHHWGSEVVLS